MEIGHRKEFQTWRFATRSDERQLWISLSLLISLRLPISTINSVDKTEIILLYSPTDADGRHLRESQ